MLRLRFAVLQYFFSSQELSCRHKPFSNSKLTDPSASSGIPHSREMTDPQVPGLNSEHLELESVSSKCRIVCFMSDCCPVEGLYALIWLPLCPVGDENLPLSDFSRRIRATVILITPVASAVLSNIGVRKVSF